MSSKSSRQAKQLAKQALEPPSPKGASLQARIQTGIFQGPMPPPEMLARYEEICPGFSERTLRMVEQQSKARQSNEERVLSAKIRHEAQGQWMAFILALFFLAVGAYALSLHEVGVGVGVWGVEFSSIIGMFVYRQWREEKRISQGLPPQQFPR